MRLLTTEDQAEPEKAKRIRFVMDISEPLVVADRMRQKDGETEFDLANRKIKVGNNKCFVAVISDVTEGDHSDAISIESPYFNPVSMGDKEEAMRRLLSATYTVITNRIREAHLYDT